MASVPEFHIPQKLTALRLGETHFPCCVARQEPPLTRGGHDMIQSTASRATEIEQRAPQAGVRSGGGDILWSESESRVDNLLAASVGRLLFRHCESVDRGGSAPGAGLERRCGRVRRIKVLLQVSFTYLSHMASLSTQLLDPHG